MIGKDDDEERFSTIFPTHTRETKLYCGLAFARPSSHKRTTYSRFYHIAPTTDAAEFRNLAPAQRGNLVGLLSQSFIDQDAGIAPASMQKQVGCFDRWKRFLADNGIEDEWLAEFTSDQRTRLLSAFAGAVRRNKYGTRKSAKLRGSTVKATVTNVRSTFRAHLRSDPALDTDGKISLFLTRQLSGYVDADPSVKQEKALPLSVFRKMLENKFTPADEAMGNWLQGHFFSA